MPNSPYSQFDQMREQRPVYFNQKRNLWALTRYADIVQVLRDTSLSSDFVGHVIRRFPEEQQKKLSPLYQGYSRWLLNSNPPQHTKIRKILQKGFQPLNMRALEKTVQNIAQDLIVAMQRKGHADLIEDFAFPLPMSVIAILLGLPAEDGQIFRDWSNSLAKFMADHETTFESALKAQESICAIHDYVREWLKKKRANPQEDLISMMLNAEVDGERLEEQDILSTCSLLFFAGHETTTNFIGNSVAIFLQQGIFRKLAENPSLLPAALEEALRFESPVQWITRITQAATKVGGMDIPANQQILCLLGAANRDPEQFEKPQEFDIQRKDNRHIAFGLGMHFCIGSALSRMEAQIALSLLLRAFPNLAFAEENLLWRDLGGLRSLERLLVRF